MPLTPFNVIDVKQYGAIGDGITDDTAAIQSAINAATLDHWTSVVGTYVGTGPTLFFPSGKYKISDSLLFAGPQNFINVVGDKAMLVPDNQETMTDYAFVHSGAYNFSMEGLSFLGFKYAVNLYNSNQDSTFVTVKNCIFQGNLQSLRIQLPSSIVFIEGCKFLNNMNSLIIGSSEKVLVRDCWITSGEGMTGIHSAPIINYARTTIQDCILVPLWPNSSAIEPAWINNYNCITVKDTRQGGEPGSFTLINNFAHVGNSHAYADGDPEICTIIVSNCQCYAVYSNSGPNTPPNYMQPAVVRYVTKIPNMTTIENNWGMVYAKALGFSVYLYNEDSTAITNMINASGLPGVVNTKNVTVKLENNVGAYPYPHGSHIPLELYPYVRSNDSLWPGTRDNGLPIISKQVIEPSQDIVFKFEFPGEFISNNSFLINYSGCPLPYSGVDYRGGFIGILKANGFWSNNIHIGEPRYALVLEPIFNQIGDADPGSWPTGTFTADVYWEDTGDRFLPRSSTNKVICLKIAGRKGDASLSWLDTCTITLLDDM